ncbi:MAG: CDP-alcohol phosphatidyltransferase family protein [Chloroflexi bacterium]|nr:CDP-alcohol phosphatidyltransferase family protein [Chloroflexota bacterium]
MISDLARRWSFGLVAPVATWLGKLGISPNVITLIGFLLNVGMGLLLSQTIHPLTGMLVMLAGAFDSLDGMLARLTHRASIFGAFFDSTLDRWSESAIFFGLLYYYSGQGAVLEVRLIFLAIVGSLLVSYTRARAEALQIPCQDGLLTRFERVVILGLGLLLGPYVPILWTLALWILAFGTLFTAIQRIYAVWRYVQQNPQREENN